MNFKTQNPTNLEQLQEYSYLGLQDSEKILDSLFCAQKKWAFSSLGERKGLLQSLGQEFLKNKETLARQMALEMGKPYLQGVAEVEKSVLCADYYIQHLDQFLETEKVIYPGHQGLIRKEALGVLFSIMPWNFPVWQLVRFAFPALAAGNAVMMKHSDLTAGTAAFIEKIFSEAGAGHLLKNAHLSHEDSAKIISDYRIRGVTFTGSTRGGRQVAEVAGRSLKKTVLELGGSDAYLVLEDADVRFAAEACAKSRMVNGGQSCVAAKRFFVHASIFDSFLKEFSAQLQKYPMGDPFDSQSLRGPLAHIRFQQQIHSQVESMVSSGQAELLFGGQLPESRGAFYPATVLLMKEQSKLWVQEFFGPVACIWKFQDEEKVIEQANRCVYGLGGAVFSKNESRALALSRKIESGIVSINDMLKSDPHLPFGGVKDSGYGRELSGYGLTEFLNIQSVMIKS